MAQNVPLLESRLINKAESSGSRLKLMEENRDFNVYHGSLEKFGEIVVFVRLPKARDDGAVTPFQVMLSEFATLTLLQLRVPKSVPVPRPICIDEDQDNLVGGPWIATTLTKGSFLNDIFDTLTPEQRETVIDSVAETYYRILMSRSRTFSKIGSIYRHQDRQQMARDWFFTDVDDLKSQSAGFFVGPIAACPPCSNGLFPNAEPPNIWHCGPFESADKWLAAIASRDLDYTGAPSVLSLDERRDRERDVNEILGRMRREDRDFRKILVLEHPAFSLSCILVDPTDPTKIVSILGWSGARVVPSWAINPPLDIPESIGHVERIHLINKFASRLKERFPEQHWRNSGMFDKLLVAQNSHVRPESRSLIFKGKTMLQRLLTEEDRDPEKRLPEHLDSIINRFSG